MTLLRLAQVYWIKVAVLATGLFFAIVCSAQQQGQQNKDDLLKIAVQDYLKGLSADDRTTRYSRVFVDLTDDGNKEAIVYLSSDGWCGTGGCTLLILAPKEKSYRIVTKIPAVRLPIFLLSTKSHGWHNLGFVARISGVEPLYKGILSFDGENYKSDPAMPPTDRSNEKTQGKVVMPYTAKDRPLYK